jgi:glutathione S-transferase
MAATLYELEVNGRRWSAYCWRSCLALAHKRVSFDTIGVDFSDRARVFALTGTRWVPALVDGGRTISGSWNIAVHLEGAYSDAPSLFGGPQGQALAQFIDTWANNVIEVALAVVVWDIFELLDVSERECFRKTREARLGATLESLRENRAVPAANVHAMLRPLSTLLATRNWLCGETPGYADYSAFSIFQWLRCVSHYPFLEPEDPINGFVDRCSELYDGMAGSVPMFHNVARSLAGR